MLPSGERHPRKISQHYVVLRTHEDDITWISRPYVKKTQLRQRIIPGPLSTLHSSLSASRTLERRKDYSFRKQHHDPGKVGPKGTPKPSGLPSGMKAESPKLRKHSFKKESHRLQTLVSEVALQMLGNVWKLPLPFASYSF